VIHLQAYARFFNVVGNVLGRTGYYTTYESNLENNPLAIFSFGAPDTQPTSDPLVKTTLMRWGNYDTVNGAVQWNASEVPSGLSQYANPTPANHNLPASFYLFTKPSWFGAVPLAAVGPDAADFLIKPCPALLTTLRLTSTIVSAVYCCTTRTTVDGSQSVSASTAAHDDSDNHKRARSI
jgi:hypothetical protein